MADQSFHASWLARIASSTTSGVAVWYSQSTFWWSCGQTFFARLPVRISFPPTISGISIVSAAISASRFFSDCVWASPGR